MAEPTGPTLNMQSTLPGALPEGAPVESAMTTPQPGAGESAHGAVQVQIAMRVLESALPMVGAMTAEGEALMRAMQTLKRAFGDSTSKNQELVPSEIMSLMASMPKGAGGMPPPGAGASPLPGAGAPPPGV